MHAGIYYGYLEARSDLFAVFILAVYDDLEREDLGCGFSIRPPPFFALAVIYGEKGYVHLNPCISGQTMLWCMMPFFFFPSTL